MNAFYAHSTNREIVVDTKILVESGLKKKNIHVIDTEEMGKNMLIDKIIMAIKECDLFVCDLTPDYILNEEWGEDTKNVPLTNPNVMFEVGYALSMQHLNQSNIIFLLNTKITKKRPSLVEGYHYFGCDSDDKNYHKNIINFIEKLCDVNPFMNSDGWCSQKYTLTDKFLASMAMELDVTPTSHFIRINKKEKNAVILFTCSGGIPRVVYIMTKILRMKDKYKCLSYNDYICNELKHLELIANSEWFK